MVLCSVSVIRKRNKGFVGTIKVGLIDAKYQVALVVDRDSLSFLNESNAAISLSFVFISISVNQLGV